MNRSEINARLMANKVFAVVRLNEGDEVFEIIDAVRKGGVKNIELTLTTPNAFGILPELLTNFSGDCMIGVGSVLTVEQAEKAVSGGSKYIVSPITNEDVMKTAHTAGIPVFPGAYTPTEIINAYNLGADAVKVFPADTLGMKYFKGILAPMPHLKIMPTGGVSLTNGGEWFAAGACAVGIGSALFDKKAIKEKDYSVLTENAKIIMKSVNGGN